MDKQKINAIKTALRLLSGIGDCGAKTEMDALASAGAGDSDATSIAVALMWDAKRGNGGAMDVSVFNKRLAAISLDIGSGDIGDANRAAAFILMNGGESRGLTDDDLTPGVNHAPATGENSQYQHQIESLYGQIEKMFLAAKGAERSQWIRDAIALGESYVRQEIPRFANAA